MFVKQWRATPLHVLQRDFLSRCFYFNQVFSLLFSSKLFFDVIFFLKIGRVNIHLYESSVHANLQTLSLQSKEISIYFLFLILKLNREHLAEDHLICVCTSKA